MSCLGMVAKLYKPNPKRHTTTQQHSNNCSHGKDRIPCSSRFSARKEEGEKGLLCTIPQRGPTPSLLCSSVDSSRNRIVGSWMETRDQLDKHAVSINFANCAFLLSRCGEPKVLSKGRHVHDCIVQGGLERRKFLGDLLVQMYGKCGALEDALVVFNELGEGNLFAWNAMIVAYAYNGQSKKALQLYKRMKQERVTPNKFIFASILSACANQEALVKGRRIHSHVKKHGFETDVVVGTALVNMYGKCGSIDDARRVFDKMPERDKVSWNAMIAVCAQQENHKDAIHLFDQMQQEGVLPDKFTLASVLDACVSQEAMATGKVMHTYVLANVLESDVVVGTAVINMYGKCGSLQDAWRTFESMPDRNRATFISILSACASRAALQEGQHLHAGLACSGFTLDVNVGNALINMYGKCGSLEDASKLFDGMPRRDVISWNAMLAVYSQSGLAQSALQLLSKMQWQGVTPNIVTFVSMLSACSHAGLLNEGYRCFLSMQKDHKVAPSVDHYNCMVDLLGRAGQLDEAEQLITTMPIEPTVISWTTLLGACKNQTDLQRGEQVAKHVIGMDPGNPAHHVMLANIYYVSGRADDAAKVMSGLRDMVRVNQESLCAI